MTRRGFGLWALCCEILRSRYIRLARSRWFASRYHGKSLGTVTEVTP